MLSNPPLPQRPQLIHHHSALRSTPKPSPPFVGIAASFGGGAGGGDDSDSDGGGGGGGGFDDIPGSDGASFDGGADFGAGGGDDDVPELGGGGDGSDDA